MDTWLGLAPLLHHVGVQISLKNVQSILGPDYEIPTFLSSLWVEESDSNGANRLSLIRRSQLDTHMQFSEGNNNGITGQNRESRKYLFTALKWIGSEIRRLIELEVGNEFDSTENERVCIVVVYTLLRDRWFELRKCTKARNPNVQYVYLLWFLYLAYRLQRRRPVRLDHFKYKGLHFIKKLPLPLDSEQLSILNWEPWRVYQGLILLDTKYVRSVTLYDQEEAELLFLYRDLLLDRCADIAHTPLSGTVESLVHDHHLWIKNMNESIRTSEDKREGLADFMDMDILRRIDEEKKRRDESYTDQAVYDPGAEKKAAELNKKFVSAQEHLANYTKNIGSHELDNMKDTLKVLIAMKEKYDTLIRKVHGPDNASITLIEAKRMNEVQIENVKRFIEETEQVKMDALTQEENRKLNELRQKAIASIIKGAEFDGNDGKGGSSMFCAQVPWAMDNGYLGFSLCKWQPQLIVNFESTTSRLHVKLKQILMAKALDNVRLINPITMAERIKAWIYRIETTLMRREIYRQRVNYKASFADFSAWKQVVMNPVAETDKFPKTIQEYLNRENPFSFMAMAHMGYDFLVQMFPVINVDTTLFYWDLEDELLSLERGRIGYPVMCLLGSNWAVYQEGQIQLADDQGFKSTGRDFFDCLTQYCLLLHERNWRVLQRGENKELDLRKSILATLTRNALE